VELTLYRPIGLSTLLRLCDEWTLAARNGIVDLFGRHFFLTKSARTEPGLLSELRLKKITNLIIKPGAYVSLPTDIRDLIPWHPIQGVEWYMETVCIEDEVNAEGIGGTLAMMMDHSGRGEAIDSDSQASRPLIIFQCSPSVLDMITDKVSRRLACLICAHGTWKIRDSDRPPFFDCLIRLSGLTTRKSMEQHITALAEAYSAHWVHRTAIESYTGEFMTVEAMGLPGECTCPGAVGYKADLSLGWEDEQIQDDFDPAAPDHLSGFTANLWETDGMGEDRGWSDLIWLRAYPMDNIPIPAYMRDPSAEIAPQGRA
jgi:hypothetical protein